MLTICKHCGTENHPLPGYERSGWRFCLGCGKSVTFPKERRVQDIPTEIHRRWDDCTMDPVTKACKGCGKPMSEESLINRAL